MYCNKCGTKLRDDARFCVSCGASVAPAASPVVTPAPTPAPTPTPAHAPAAPTEKKRSPAFIIGIVGLILLLLLIIGGIVFAVRYLINGLQDGKTAVQDYSYEIDEYEEETISIISEETTSDMEPYYADIYPDVSGYLLPESDSRYLTAADIQNLTPAQMNFACYEIEARHGATFSDPDVQAVFDEMAWYSPGSTTELSSIEQTNLTYLRAKLGLIDGSSYYGNPYMSYFGSSSSYMFSGSQNSYLGNADLRSLTEYELTIARNEIYARHGYIFSSEDLQVYFSCKDWYSPAIPGDVFDADSLSSVEDGNVELIKIYEDIAEGITPAADNSYMDYYNDWYIFADSDSRKLEEYDLIDKSREELIIARNEIFARHGYSFSDDDLFAYFYGCSWYTPEVAPGRLDLISLNSAENYNVNFLLDHQNRMETVSDLSKLNTELSYEISTDYFSLSLPKYFKKYCDINKSYSGSDYYISFYDNLSSDCQGGHAFTIGVFPSSSDYSYLPAYQTVGSLMDEDGNTWNVVLISPTDVQACYVIFDFYGKMADEASRILETISPNSGYTFLWY